MIWTLEEEQYRVELPLDTMWSQMYALERRKRLKTKYPVFTGQAPVLVPKDKVATISVAKDGRKLEERLWHSHNDPMRAVEVGGGTEVAAHLMLVPLDRGGKPVDMNMRDAYEDGDIIQAGYLYLDGKPTNPLYTHMQAGHTLGDAPGSETHEQLSWVFCQGCFISVRQLFTSTPEKLWDLLYVR